MLNRDLAQSQFRDILIIGAGSGNDLSRAPQWAAPKARIDAVEIDPISGNSGYGITPIAPIRIRVSRRIWVTDVTFFVRQTENTI